MFYFVIITRETKDVTVIDSGTAEEMEAMHGEESENYDNGLFSTDVIDEDNVSTFTGRQY